MGVGGVDGERERPVAIGVRAVPGGLHRLRPAYAQAVCVFDVAPYAGIAACRDQAAAEVGQSGGVSVRGGYRVEADFQLVRRVARRRAQPHALALIADIERVEHAAELLRRGRGGQAQRIGDACRERVRRAAVEAAAQLQQGRAALGADGGALGGRACGRCPADLHGLADVGGDGGCVHAPRHGGLGVGSLVVRRVARIAARDLHFDGRRVAHELPHGVIGNVNVARPVALARLERRARGRLGFGPAQELVVRPRRDGRWDGHHLGAPFRHARRCAGAAVRVEADGVALQRGHLDGYLAASRAVHAPCAVAVDALAPRIDEHGGMVGFVLLPERGRAFARPLLVGA